jgi:hypothetical protein
MAVGFETRQNQLRTSRTWRWFIIWIIGIALINYAFEAGLPQLRSDVKPYLMTTNFNSWDDGWVQVEGTWEASGDPLAARINYSKITCRADVMECQDISAEVMHDMLAVDVQTRRIVNWTNQTITTEDVKTCQTYALLINRQTQTISALVTRPDSLPQSCAGLAPIEPNKLSKRMELRLIDGLKRWEAEESRIEKTVFEPWRTGLFLLFTGLVAFFLFRVWSPKMSR